MNEEITKGTVHVYFAGGSRDGVIESLDNPPLLMRFLIEPHAYDVYQLQAIEKHDNKALPAMRGRQATYVFTGVEYDFGEDS